MSVDLTRATKAELLDEVVRLRAIVEAPKAATREMDPEALAADRCVVALASLVPRTDRTGYGSGYTMGYRGTEEIGRVLRYLAGRFGVALVEIQTEPCARRHVDEVGSVDLAWLLRDSS